MKDLIKRSGFVSIAASLIFLVLGLILINHPEGTIKVVSYILGGLLIIFGVFRLGTYFSTREKFAYYDFNLTVGALCFLAGLIIIVFGTAIASLFGIMVGIWIVLTAINRINFAFRLKEEKVKYWYVSLIIALLVISAGLYIIFAPELILITLGYLLISYSIMDIIQSIIFIVNTKKIFND